MAKTVETIKHCVLVATKGVNYEEFDVIRLNLFLQWDQREIHFNDLVDKGRVILWFFNRRHYIYKAGISYSQIRKVIATLNTSNEIQLVFIFKEA